jgi:hypothetical protein
MAGDGFTYDPATIDAALKHFRNALEKQRGQAARAADNLKHVKRPGEAPATKMYHKRLETFIEAIQQGGDDGIEALKQVIEALEDTKKQYEKNEDVTWKGLKGLEGKL